jgi:hypothetical protein
MSSWVIVYIDVDTRRVISLRARSIDLVLEKFRQLLPYAIVRSIVIDDLPPSGGLRIIPRVCDRPPALGVVTAV